MRTGIANLPLDYGRCPKWLFERMQGLSRGIVIAIVEEFGAEEFLRRLADPVWFQSLSCVIGMDWNSSGTTTITLGALKSGIFDLQDELGLYICGGKKVSRNTPHEIEKYAQTNNLSFSTKLIYASKMAAKVDSCLIQNLENNFQLYHHNFIFTKKGEWAVIQQAMSPTLQRARRYHWLSSQVEDFIQEPHLGIVSEITTQPLNLTAKKSKENREISTELVKEAPKTFLRDIKLITEKKNSLIRERKLPGFKEIELEDVEFYWHPVLKERFDLKRLERTIFFANLYKPKNFEQLLAIKGVGPKTIRALSLVSEIIYGAKPSFEDPARYSFAVGGKDGTPYPIDYQVYDRLLEIMEKGIKKSNLNLREKEEAQKRLKQFRNLARLESRKRT